MLTTIKQGIKRAIRPATRALRLKHDAASGRRLRDALGPRAVGIVAEVESGTFVVAPDDFGVGRAMLLHGAHANAEVERLAPHLTPETRLLVVGAHVGTLLVPLARRVAQVVAPEPNPDNARLLRMNLALNGVSNCEVLPLAASDRDEEITFQLSTANSGGSKRKPARDRYDYSYDRPREITVQAARLDDRLAGRTFDVIVMDVEGSEYFALGGMPRLLSAARLLQVKFLPWVMSDVAGVSATELVGRIGPFFDTMRVPSRGMESVPVAEAAAVLETMAQRSQYDDGLMFENWRP